jgi:orotate phosphoribosyltransferase
VLLIDDLFVTGARMFSAASALVYAGHTVAASLVLARRVNRDWGECQQLWDRQASLPFSWATSPLTAEADPQLLRELRAGR